MTTATNRRDFLLRSGLSAAAANLMLSVPSLSAGETNAKRKATVDFRLLAERRDPQALLAGQGRCRF